MQANATAQTLFAKIFIPHNVYYVNISGGDSKEDPPVPMPNTEVKLLNVDDTWRVTARESRKLPEQTTTQKITVIILPLSFVYTYIPL